MADQAPGHGERFLPDRTLMILSLARGQGAAMAVLTMWRKMLMASVA